MNDPRNVANGPRYVLLAGWLGLGVVLATLTLVNPNHYTSPDSAYYLRMADQLRRGDLAGWDATFPPGYPALIALFSPVTGGNLLWASKLVNWGAVGVFAWRWHRRLGPNVALWLLAVWFLGEFLRIAAYTWSETVFLILLAEWIWALHRSLQDATVFLLGVALFLTRYVGGFVFGVTALIVLVPSGWFLRKTLRINLGLVTLAGATFMLAYFALMQALTGEPWGGPRFFPTATFPVADVALALLNELLLIRDFVSGWSALSPNNTLAWAGLGAQLVLAVLFYRSWQRSETANTARWSPLARLFLGVGVCYVIVLLVLRSVSPFAGPNARLLAPATFCGGLGLALWLAAQPAGRQNVARRYVVALIVLSWMQLLPQGAGVRTLQSWHSIISKSPVRAEMRTKPSAATTLLLPVR